jgi:hypothetical protein
VREDAPGLVRSLRDSGVLCGLSSPRRIRMVTHYGIERADIDEALERVRSAALARV